MTPKLCSAETMLWFYLKQAELALGEPWLYILGYTLAILPLQRLNNPLVEAQRNEDLFQLGVKPNYFRRSQVKLDLAPSLVFDTTKVPVHSATTSPNPDSRSARPIQVHFNNFHLQLNYCGLKLDVPGTRLITSQVMLNYHTLIYILKTTFIRPIIWHDNPKVVSPDEKICSFRDTVDFKFTSGVESAQGILSDPLRPLLGRPKSLPPDFTYGLHTETYFISSMSTIVEEFLYFYRRFHACLSYRLEGNAQASEFIFDDKSTTAPIKIPPSKAEAVASPPGAGAVARVLSEIFPNLRSISCAGIRGAISGGWRELEALLPEFVATRVKENSGTVIDPEVTVFTLAAPCPSRPGRISLYLTFGTKTPLMGSTKLRGAWYLSSALELAGRGICTPLNGSSCTNTPDIQSLVLNQDADCATLDTLTEFVGIPPTVEN
ncbi:hypothetical protein DFH08DRAFT_818420 [Mycena albidolilacea]|uniref:Uncharacterized protein n=1 Tax=Mycena albidolilacea TaxID=1033008 RepID=A0AAD6ZGL2_9AGAR|nr:hypothetical protein DFH08DRAFT_818420 [Mycena albidolilacea]